MTRFAIIAALAALALPATALAADPTGPDRENAARLCKGQLSQMGAADFRALYAPTGPASSAFGKCVSQTARAQATNRVNAARQCRAERNDPNFAASHEGKSFTEFYGPGRNAFGKCVAGKAKQSGEAQQQATINAARQCKAERAGGAAAFREKYGMGPRKVAAFGRCVAGKLTA